MVVLTDHIPICEYCACTTEGHMNASPCQHGGHLL